MARTFGRYEVSVTDYGLSYARYHWRGKVWAFPTGPMHERERPTQSILDGAEQLRRLYGHR